MRGLHMEHGPDAVRRELALWNESRVPSHWVRLAMAGCQKCAERKTSQARLTAMRRAYQRKTA